MLLPLFSLLLYSLCRVFLVFIAFHCLHHCPSRSKFCPICSFFRPSCFIAAFSCSFPSLLPFAFCTFLVCFHHTHCYLHNLGWFFLDWSHSIRCMHTRLYWVLQVKHCWLGYSVWVEWLDRLVGEIPREVLCAGGSACCICASSCCM